MHHLRPNFGLQQSRYRFELKKLCNLRVNEKKRKLIFDFYCNSNNIHITVRGALRGDRYKHIRGMTGYSSLNAALSQCSCLRGDII
jgi:hypothetical protein